ncbi:MULTISPECIES: GNAT family N-acetyltransferase [unclassified Variovorax]|uniref:GNAT family N-acetyltransferase n=1 Tax=unclassified Variovorax TaxID=663243 RepID=UPI0008B81030|nr:MULTISPECIES: GNAT family N-acetyltransferase [unclassified Variovorax]SEJ48260.1 N-acetylglutamate synthase, GNAT family [Variovorax sp. OK202]SFC49455.1 N-acetylglutamate synthase, GNAT family [Variovorax sp. OK212]
MPTTNPPEARAGSRSVIRRSKPEDIALIRSWLEAEDAAGVHGNFLCNWSVIARAHEDQELLVYIDGKTGLPVAFQLGRLLQSGILQVKQDFRGRGIGKKMVAYCVNLARHKGEDLLVIQCKPSSSIPFWQRMGFTLIPDSDPPNKAYRVLERRHDLPAVGKPVDVVIRFYPEERKWRDACAALVQLAASGKELPDGVIQLDRRISFHEDAYPLARDVVVEAEVNGVRQFIDKAKYRELQQRGVTRCRNGWFIDQIRPEESH